MIGMKIFLENVAILKMADIEINGITVTAGLNGTGKTTVGKSVYATLNAYKDLPDKILNARRDSIWREIFLGLRNHRDITKNYSPFDIAFKFDKELTNELLLTWKKEGDFVVKKDIYERLRKYDIIQSEDIETLCEGISGVIQRSDNDYIEYLVESYFNRVFKNQINHFCITDKGRFEWESSELQFHMEFQKNELLAYDYVSFFDQKAVYIESQNVLDAFQSYKTKSRHSEEISFVSNELFHLLGREAASQETLEDYMSAKEINNIVDVIMNKVTHGTLRMEGAEEFTFYDQSMDHSVDISNLSAGLKIFVVIQRLLENGSLRKGDILLIDEPEINLHPEWQVVFAEILVRMQKDLGIYIYLNTHSPYFIHAIEVKMAEHEIADRGKYYLMEKDVDGLCYSIDVTGNTEKIYELLYKPLEM